ncbi:hypothetical protein [Stenotrophomonas phage RAS14]
MKKVAWVIQTNLLQDSTVLGVWNSAKELGCDTHEAIIIPFQEEMGNEEELMAIPVDDVTVIPYGSCKLARISNARGWKGNCYVDETFRTDVWLRERDDMLNKDAVMMMVKDTEQYLKDVPDDEEFFIRPVKDLKSFSGSVAEAHDIRNWMNSTKSGNFSFTEDTEIIIAPIQKLYSESRFFIVGGKVVDGSYYRMGGSLQVSAIKQPEMYELAQTFADKWLPHECCVMDLAETDDGYRVIEFNTINSSGFYEHDIRKIVTAMTEWGRNQ